MASKKPAGESKKDYVLERWESGERDLWKLASEAGTTLSYVAGVLQSAGRIDHYYDLFTSAKDPLNVYSALFKGRLGFKNLATAEASVQALREAYRVFENLGDRAGQHHCMVTALMLYHRAIACRKTAEAEVFRKWMIDRLLLDSVIFSSAEALAEARAAGSKAADATPSRRGRVHTLPYEQGT